MAEADERIIRPPDGGCAGYRALMSDGAPIGCLECEREGRPGVMMTYRGVELVSLREGVPATLTLDRRGYDLWECPRGHHDYDGY